MWKDKLFRSQLSGENQGTGKVSRIRNGTQNGSKISAAVNDVKSTLNQAASIWRILNPPDKFLDDEDYMKMGLDELSEALVQPNFYHSFIYFLEKSAESGRIEPKTVENGVCDLISVCIFYLSVLSIIY